MVSLDILLAEIWKKEPTITIIHCAFSNEVIMENTAKTISIKAQGLSNAIIRTWLLLYAKDRVKYEELETFV